MNLLLGIDLGTSSVKVALVNGDDLSVIKSSSAEYPIFGDQPGYAEQAPNAWWQAIVQATKAVTVGQDPKLIRGIGVDGQMHGLVCADSDGQPVRPAII
ncbi:MAG: FGGY family carbohydrate kinase, partial [Chloroflexota bacterium]